MLLCFLGINPSFDWYSNWTTELFRLLGRESLYVSIVYVALLIGGWIQDSRDIQTELQNCFAYWGVKAYVFQQYMLLCLLGINPSFKRYSNWTTELFRLLGRESLCVSIVHVALLIGGSIQASRDIRTELQNCWKLMCFNSTCCSAYWGSIQASRDIQTELQNCFAYWGVKAHIFHSACCSAYWGMNPRFKRYSNWATELFRLLGRESLCVSIVHVALLIGDQSKLKRYSNWTTELFRLLGRESSYIS